MWQLYEPGVRTTTTTDCCCSCPWKLSISRHQVATVAYWCQKFSTWSPVMDSLLHLLWPHSTVHRSCTYAQLAKTACTLCTLSSLQQILLHTGNSIHVSNCMRSGCIPRTYVLQWNLSQGWGLVDIHDVGVSDAAQCIWACWSLVFGSQWFCWSSHSWLILLVKDAQIKQQWIDYNLLSTGLFVVPSDLVWYLLQINSKRRKLETWKFLLCID